LLEAEASDIDGALQRVLVENYIGVVSGIRQILNLGKSREELPFLAIEAERKMPRLSKPCRK